MLDGEVIPNFDFANRIKIDSQDFARELGLTQNANDLFLCTLDGTIPCLFKRFYKIRRNPKVQLFVDQMKPFFGVVKMGCSMVEVDDKWCLLVKLHGDGKNLSHLTWNDWLYAGSEYLIQFVRIILCDIFVGKRWREKRNVVWVNGGEYIMPCDEEKAMDFASRPKFDMAANVRKLIVAELSRMKVKDMVKECLDRANAGWSFVESEAGRIFGGEVAEEVMKFMIRRRDPDWMYNEFSHYLWNKARVGRIAWKTFQVVYLWTSEDYCNLKAGKGQKSELADAYLWRADEHPATETAEQVWEKLAATRENKKRVRRGKDKVRVGKV